MKTLDRFILREAFTRWALVLGIGMFLIMVGEIIGKTSASRWSPRCRG